jgi:filamentous hemagglutinin family protein
MPAPAALTVVVSLSLGTVAPVIAGPAGGVVVSGQGSISKPSTDTTVINQSSSQLQLNWNSFNVASNESVLFKQPSSSAIAFNRILDQNPSQIFGRVQGNGQVVLVNPNGFLIGRTATLNVNSLVVSSLNAIDFDPVSGRYRFSATGKPGSIVNEGAITAGPGGSVTLLGGRVSNSGSIVADFGTVNLAAGRTATLDLAGDGLLRLEVDSELLSNTDGGASAVENSGTIRADGGRVLLTASAVKDVFTNLINNAGVVRANRIDNSGGTIELLGPGGDVLSNGTLDASAGDGKSSGGSVSVLGNRVALAGNASVDVSGATNGGTALIGGDEHGSNPAVLDAQDTYVSPGATINADAGGRGDGGKIVVWANGVTEYEGSLSARGGALSGNGGNAEVSGKESLIFAGTADLTALNGSWGTLLLDPDYIVIDNSNTQPANLDTGTGVWDFGVDTGLGPNGAKIGAQAIDTLLDTVSLTLNANNSIIQTSTSNIDVSGDGAASGKSLALNSNGTMQLNGTIKLNGGNLQLKVLSTNGAGTLDLQGTVELNGGSFGAESAGNLTMGGTVSTTGTGNVSLLSDNGTLTMQTGSSISAGSGLTALGAHGDIAVTSMSTTGNASVISSAGSISTGTHTGAAITAGQLDLEGDGGTVGVSGTGGAIDTDASQLQVTALNGDVYVDNAGTLLLTSGVGRTTGSGAGSVNVTTDNGTLTMESVSANGPVVFWAKQGGVQWDGTGSGIQAPSTTLTAGNGSVGSLAHPIPLAVSSATATATGGITLSGPGGTLTLDGITARGAGNIVGPTNDILITNNVGTIVDSGAGIIGDDLTLTAAQAIGASGTPIVTHVNTLNTTANGGGTYIRNSGDVTLTSIVEGSGIGDVDISTTSGGALKVGSVGSPTKVTLNAGGGIVKNGAGTISAPTIDLQAGAGIGAIGQVISTNATTVSAAAHGGDLYLTDTNAAPVALTTATASAPGTIVNVTDTAGNLKVGTVGASGSVTLTANAGAIVDDLSDTTKITTNHLILSAGTGIGAATAPNDIDTAASTIDASTTNGGIYITNNTGIPNSALALGGTTGVTATGAAGTVNVTNASGDITVGTVSTSNQAALTAAGAIQAGAGTGVSSTGAGGVSLNAGTNIGTVTNFATRTGTPIAVNTNNGPLTAISTSNTGQINLNIAGAPSVAAGNIKIGSATGRAGTILLQSSSALNLSNFSAGAIDIGANNTTQLGFSTDAVLNVPSLANITDAPADALLVRGATDVVNGASRSLSFNGGSLIFQSGAAGGATTLNTTVGQLDATIIGGGKGLTVNQTGDLTLSHLSDTGGVVSVATTGNLTTGTVTGGTVGMSATGNLTVGSISGTTVNLSSSGGAIADDNNNATAVAGSAVTLSGNSLGAPGNELDTQATSLTASSSAGDIRIRQTGDLNLTANATGGAVDVQGTGALTVVGATSGSGVTLASGVGDALNVNAAVSGGSQLVSLASGAGGAVNLNAGVTTTGDVSLTAGVNGNRGAIVVGNGISVGATNLTATGTSIGSGANSLNIAVSSLTATSSGGDIVVRQAVGDLTALTASATGGAVDVQAASGSINVVSASGAGVTLVAGGSSLTLGGAINGGAQDVNLTASGAGGQINVNGPVSTTGNVALTAGTAGSRGVITSNGGAVSANTLTAMGASIGSSASSASRLSTTVTSLDATASSGGIYVKETDGLNLTASATGGELEVTTGNGALNVASATGARVTLTAGGANALTLNGPVSAGTGEVDLTAGGAIVANNGSQVTGGAAVLRGSAIGDSAARVNTTVDSLDAATTNGGIFVTETDGLALTAAGINGAVDVATTGPLTVASASGNGVTLAANGAGGVLTVNGPLSAATGSVSLTSGGALTANGAVNATAGSASLTSTGAMSVNGGVTVAGGNANLTSGGALTLASAVNAGTGNASLSATGAIVGGTGNSIAGNAVTLAGTAIGASGAPVNTAATSLNATSTGGDIFVHTDGLALTGSATGGILNVQAGGPLTVASASGTGVALTGSSIGLNGSVDGATGPVTLTAASGAITASTGVHIAGSSLTASGSALGSSSNPLTTSVASLNATSSNGGIFVNETDGLTLTAKATGGPVYVQTANGALTVSGATGTGITLRAGGAGNGITVNGAIDGGTGDVALTAGTSASRGAIAAGAGGSVAGGTLTADGSSIGASGSPLSTNINSLTANATQGGVYISEQNALTLTNVQAAGDVGVSSGTGDITVHYVNAGNGLTLTASSGAIADDGDDSTLLTGKAVTLAARSIGTPSTLAGSVLDSKLRLDLDANTLSATSTAGGIYINSMTGLSSVSLSASGGAGGNIELLTQAGDLNLLHVSASNNLLLAAGRNIFALPGLGTISAHAAELRAGGADASAGSIGTLTQPLSLQLSAGNTLHIYVPQTLDTNDPNRAPSTLPSSGVTSTLTTFSAPNSLAGLAGFGQFTGLSDTLFTSPAETLVRSIQNQTATVQSVLGLDWKSFDPNVSLFGTLDPSVCLPSDQRDEEKGTPGC